MSLRVFTGPEALAAALVDATERAAAEAIARRGRFSCALTGGSAATALYPTLAAAKVAWPQVHFYYGDERCVAPDHPDSNHRAALEALGRTGATFHPIDGLAPPAAAAEAYAAALPTLDVVHLGMGPDGHVCSLFPGHALLEERARQVAALADSPKPPAHRVTLTLPALHRAGALWLLVLGAAKAGAVKAALEDPTCELPVARAVRGAKSSEWFIDQPAAGQLAAR